jgi:mRNA interferase RelE/StbE
MLPIEIAWSAMKVLTKLPLKHGRQVAAKIQSLRDNPEPPDSIQMKGNVSAWRWADSGEYRIIYRLDNGILKIVAVGQRNNDKVYRDFDRKL